MAYRDVTSALPSDAGSTAGRRFVTVVGIDRYCAWPALNNAVNDAKGALAVFQRLGFEQIVAPLTDGAATGDAIRRLVTDDLATLNSDDSLILFFAGHGHTRTRTLQSGPVETGFLIPVDGDPADGHAATWLRIDSWLSDVARLPARHILVILDACHSGVALGAVIKWRGDGAARGGSLDEMHCRQSRRVITSALGGQRAMDGGPIHGHSLFTGCLIEALTGGLARDGSREVTGSELGLYVQRRVTSYTGSQQTPDFGTLELDHRGEIILQISMKSPEPDRDRSPRPPEPDGRVPVASSATSAPNVTAAAMPPEPQRRAAPGRAQIKPLALLARVSITVVVFVCIFVLVGMQVERTGAWIVALGLSGVLVAATVAGRWASHMPPGLRWLSARLLRRALWTVVTVITIVAGAGVGMDDRNKDEKQCRAKQAAPESLQEAIAAVMACRKIGREDDAQTRWTEFTQRPPATPGALRGSFADEVAEAERQPDTVEGNKAAIAGYRRAMQAGALDAAQLAQLALRLRTYARALLARHDYDHAICELEEAKIRDPKIDVAADLAAVHAAEHPRDRGKPPTDEARDGDPDAFAEIEFVEPETAAKSPGYFNRRGCKVLRGSQP